MMVRPGRVRCDVAGMVVVIPPPPLSMLLLLVAIMLLQPAADSCSRQCLGSALGRLSVLAVKRRGAAGADRRGYQWMAVGR